MKRKQTKKAPELTKFELTKKNLIDVFNNILSRYDDDIESGINERYYDEEDNKEPRALIAEARKVIKEFTEYVPAIYVLIERGTIQGVSATESILINQFDVDNYNYNGDDESGATPESWGEIVQNKTKNGEIKSVY